MPAKHFSIIKRVAILFVTFVTLLVSGCLGGCGGGTAAAPLQVKVSSTTYATAGHPWEAIVSSSGSVLVSVTADTTTAGSQTGVQVFVPNSSGLQPSCVNALSASILGSHSASTYVANMSFFPGATDIAAGIGYPGAIFIHIADLLACNSPSGYVVSQGSTPTVSAGTLNVVITSDGNFAFVSNEYGVATNATTNGNIGIVSIQRDINGNITTGTLIGQIPTGGNAIAGMSLSPDSTRLYVTSEIAAVGTIAAGSSNAVLTKSGCVQTVGSPSNINGLLTVIDVAKAKISPGTGAILATVAAGCSPTRMTETANGATLWLSARGDNRVLAFNTALLESNPNHALLGYADTGGTAPVGLQLFHNDQLLAVANSNRFNTGVANATILNVTSPASASVVQTITTGLFPREITVGPDDATLYLTNYSSDTFQLIQTTVY